MALCFMMLFLYGGGNMRSMNSLYCIFIVFYSLYVEYINAWTRMFVNANGINSLKDFIINEIDLHEIEWKESHFDSLCQSAAIA